MIFGGFSNFQTPLAAKVRGVLTQIFLDWTLCIAYYQSGMVPISRGNVKDKIRWVKNWVYNKNFGRFWGFSNFRTPLEAKLGIMLILIIGFELSTFHTTNLAWSQCSGARFMMRWDEFKTEFIARFSGSFWGFSNFHTPLAAKIGGSSP